MEATQTGIPIMNYHPSEGAHLCSLWTDPATDRITASRFLLNLDADERALCVLEMSREGTPQTRSAAAALTTARVSVVFTDDVHVARGVFDPDRMRAFWLDQARQASKSGGRHLRAVAEMAWVLRGCPGTGQAPVFESSLNPHLQPLPVSVICQYGSSQFGSDLLLGMVLSHPLVVIEDTVFFNPFSVTHERFAAHYEAVRVDAAAALVPVWAYFLSAQPLLSSMGRFLCNSLPTLISTDRVLVILRGLASPLQLVVRDDRVIAADETLPFPAALNGLALCAEGAWGRVRSGRVDGGSIMMASFADDAGSIVATRDGTYSQQDEIRFTTLAWRAAHAIRTLKATPDDVLGRESRTPGGPDA
jgi:hypothetical protein